MNQKKRTKNSHSHNNPVAAFVFYCSEEGRALGLTTSRAKSGSKEYPQGALDNRANPAV